MSSELRIAWRSFRRYRRRSIITVVAISFGLAMMLISVGLGTDSHMRMADMGIRMGAGHVLVQAEKFQEEQTLDYVVRDAAQIVAAARDIDGVELVVRRVRASGLLAAGGKSTAVMFSGVEPESEPAASTLAADKSRVRGAYVRARREFVNYPADMYIGQELADTLDVDVGDRVVLTASPRRSERPASAAFVVSGVFRTGLDELDGFYVEIPIDAAQALVELDDDVTQVAVLLADLDDTSRVASALKQRLANRDDLEVLPWQEALSELHESIVLDDAGNYLMMAIIFVIVAIGIFNTVLMSVIERTREFGVMMAIGTSGGRLFRIVLAEALILAIVSALVGLAIGLGVHSYIASTGIDLAALYGEDMEFAGIVLEGRVYSYLPIGEIAKWTITVMALVVVSALYPAIRAARLDPVEAMRHV